MRAIIVRMAPWLCAVLVSAQVTGCIPGHGTCSEMYDGGMQDPVEGLVFALNSSGYGDQWETQGSMSRLFFIVNDYIDITLNAAHDTCSTATATLSLRLNVNGDVEVTRFTYRPNDCVTYESEPLVSIDQPDIQCPWSYEWDGSHLRVSFDSCRVGNSQPDSSGRPLVLDITIDGTIDSDPSQIGCD